MANNRFTFTVEFDSQAWASLDTESQTRWLNRVQDILNDEVYVSNVSNL